MSVKAYVMFGIIILVCGVLMIALCNVVRKADDEEKQWRERNGHKNNF